MTTTYKLYYWPGIPGRGEFVRLALEEAAVPYIDVARLPPDQGGGVPALLERMKAADGALEPFAPPFLEADGMLIAQSSNILDFLARRHGLVPDDEASRRAALQLQLTLADLVDEAHDVHHPIASSLYYEDQKPESLRRAHELVGKRIPKFLGYFERVLERRGPWLLGEQLTYPDLSLFQALGGLEYAFPRAMARVWPSLPKCAALVRAVRLRPNIAAYLESPRRQAFNQHGLFRHYPELDLATS